MVSRGWCTYRLPVDDCLILRDSLEYRIHTLSPHNLVLLFAIQLIPVDRDWLDS